MWNIRNECEATRQTILNSHAYKTAQTTNYDLTDK